MPTLPYFPQETEYSCGAACMRMAMAAQGRLLSEEELCAELKTNSEYGTLFKDMLDFLERQKISYQCQQRASFRDLKRLLSEGWQIILSYRPKSDAFDHFSVVHRISRDRIYLYDPGYGKGISYSLRHFTRLWKTTNQPDISVRWYLSIK